jgi:hypothetical protein
VYRALKDHGVYAEMSEPKNRCIRIKYADQYHIDITPCVPNAAAEHAIHVPDRELKCWKPSNPQLYAKLLEEVASAQPEFAPQLISLANSMSARNQAAVDPLPPDAGFRKALLKRIIQLLKRHRDIHFENQDVTVISIIITTLAARAYARMVHSRVYDSILDFVMTVVADMPNHIVRNYVGRTIIYDVPNPAIVGENFADKWNNNPKLPAAFDSWHARLMRDLQQFENHAIANRGNHVLTENAGAIYGRQTAVMAANTISDRIADLHRRGDLVIGPSLSLASTGVVVPKTSYYGR